VSRKTKEQKRAEAESRQIVSKRRNQLQKEADFLELKINTLEGKKKEMEQILARPETYKNSSSVVALQKEYVSTTKELEISYKNWESARLELEDLLKEIKILLK
jgi:ATP-binding cassette subfamily F protein 3